MSFPTESRLYAYTVYHGVAWCGMAALAVFLLVICSLLSGLTLALCGLDTTWLKLRSITGTPRQKQQALVVGKIKSHSTWMLCSLILCSVACGESLPFVIQSLWHGSHQWAPILLSTFSIGLFAEILPQYTIPRHAISWGYYCSPVVWGCMWLTGIISYPLARLLDTIAGRTAVHGIFTNDEMAAIIKYHEQSENNGGMISPDAARVMLGALSLDSRKIGGDIAMIPDKNTDDEKDVEKADLVVLHGLIVHWSGVKTIDINDVVDENFIAKINTWSYSRFPVIGDPQSHNLRGDPAATNYRWREKQIFGFLHVKNLVGLEIRNKGDSKTGVVTVRDLPLYSLPIIHEDMSVYDLLSIFQLGMSRMAIVVPRPLTTSQSTLETPPKDDDGFQALRWTALEKPQVPTTEPTETGDGSIDQAVNSGVDTTACHDQSITGVILPKPIGIITFEDIIDAILQKTSLDESDFFNRGNIPPPTKSKKAADYTKFICSYIHNRHGVPLSPRKTAACRPPIPTSLRRRNVSNKMQKPSKAYAMDGVDELSIDSASATTTQLRKVRNEDRESSYSRDSHTNCHEGEAPTPIKKPKRSSSQVKTGSLPSRRSIAAVLPGESTPFWRHVSAAPKLPQFQRVTPFSRQSYSSYEIPTEDDTKKSDLVPKTTQNLSSPNHVDQLKPQSNSTNSGVNIDKDLKNITIPKTIVDSTHDDSQEAFSLVSWCPVGLVDVEEWNARIEDSPDVTTKPIDSSRTSATSSETMFKENTTITQPYEGFPPELLTSTRKENHFPSHHSSTLPRMNGRVVGINEPSMKDEDLSRQEESFHDDRTLLPNQRKLISNTAAMTPSGTRSSSFWI